MKSKAFGIFELLIVLIIAMVIFFGFFNNRTGKKNPFDDNTQIKTRQTIENKINEIEQTKQLQKTIEKNLQEGN